MPPANDSPTTTPISERIDVWLDVACLFKTRSEAARAVSGGKVEVNGDRVKPHRVLRPGDQLVIQRGNGRKQTVIVRACASQHLSKALARQLYDDVTPPPPPEQIEARRIERLLRAAAGPVVRRAPDKRDRRALRRLTGKPS
jgi:ribosome-associated heat shock protein Hsp15